MILDLFYLIYFFFCIPFLVLRGRWHDGFAFRFGCFPKSLVRDLAWSKNIWVHAVSVGEAGAAEAVIKGLRARYPDHRIVLSVTTRAGHAFACQKYAVLATVIWSPLDLSGTVRRFINVIRPVIYVVVETELWPHLFARLAEEKVPVVIINARISDQAYPGYCLARPVIKTMLGKVSLVCAQSALDAERFISLGVLKDAVKVVGNVKFDVIASLDSDGPAARSAFGFSATDKVWVAASTHPGEEALVLDVFTALRDTFPWLRLVLVPRHPERAAAVALLLRQKGYKPMLFTDHEARVVGSEEVLVIDEIGHLMRLYVAADIVLMGKSFGIPRRGGQNPIEPAACGKPVITGPFMENFRDVMRLFRSAEAVIEIQDAASLRKALQEILVSPDKSNGLAARARAVVDRNRGAAVRTVDLIADTGIRRR